MLKGLVQHGYLPADCAHREVPGRYICRTAAAEYLLCLCLSFSSLFFLFFSLA